MGAIPWRYELKYLVVHVGAARAIVSALRVRVHLGTAGDEGGAGLGKFGDGWVICARVFALGPQRKLLRSPWRAPPIFKTIGGLGDFPLDQIVVGATCQIVLVAARESKTGIPGAAEGIAKPPGHK